MNDSVPSKSSVVDNDVDLAVSKLGSPLDELGDVFILQQIAGDGNGAAAGLIDVLCDFLGFGYCVLAD